MHRLLKILVLIVLLFTLSLAVLQMVLPYERKCDYFELPLAMGEEIPHSYGEVLLVLGGGCDPGCGTEERINLAASLYHEKRRTILMSDGICDLEERSRFTQRMIHHWGFKAEDILWDTLSLNTEENIKQSNRIVENRGLDYTIVCTSPFHQARTSILMYKYWNGEFKVAAMQAEHFELNRTEPYSSRRLDVIVDEYRKVIYELLTWLSS